MTDKKRDSAWIAIVIIIVLGFTAYRLFTQQSPSVIQEPVSTFTYSTTIEEDCCLQPSVFEPAAITPVKRTNKPTLTTKENPKRMRLNQPHACQIPIDQDSLLEVNDVLSDLQQEEQLYKFELKIHKHLTVKVLAPSMPRGFWSQYEQNMATILYIYQEIFGFYLLNKQEINLIIIPSRDQYINTLGNLSIDGSYSQGLFWQSTNMAFVEYKNDTQVMHTALHESVHTLNHFFAGFIARWLNEGLAEYFERIISINNKYKFDLQLGSIKQPAKEIGDLLTANQLWNISESERSSLYSSALLFTAYLYKHQITASDYTPDINILQKLLKKESEDFCTSLSDNDYQAIIDEDYLYLPESFPSWDEKRLKLQTSN